MTGTKARGGRARAGGSQSSDSGTRCEDIKFETIVNSPVPTVLAQLAKWKSLEVVLDSAGNRKTVVVQHNGETVGSITSSQAGRLIECLSKGIPYKAIVIDISRGLCKVEVSAVETQ